MLFPDAFAHVQSRWKIPSAMQGKDTGALANPKEMLQRTLPAPRFRESDGPRIAEAAKALGLLTRPDGRNRSYTDFVTELADWTTSGR